MKLPSKIAGFKLPKFGKKEADDEDDDDSGFDPSELEGDPDVDIIKSKEKMEDGGIYGEADTVDETDTDTDDHTQ